jgi:hypothetical protein
MSSPVSALRPFQDARVLKVLRPLVAVLGLAGAMWHSTHVLSAYQQYAQYRVSDPPLSDYFWGAFQTELAVSVASLFAGVVAWHLFKPRPKP